MWTIVDFHIGYYQDAPCAYTHHRGARYYEQQASCQCKQHVTLPACLLSSLWWKTCCLMSLTHIIVFCVHGATYSAHCRPLTRDLVASNSSSNLQRSNTVPRRVSPAFAATEPLIWLAPTSNRKCRGPGRIPQSRVHLYVIIPLNLP